MTRRVAPVAALAALAVAPAPARAQPDPAAAGIALRVPGMDSVAVTRDVRYRGALAMDVYRPRDAASPRPAVLLVHGGVVPGAAPPPRTWGAFASWARLLAASGMVGVAFDHRGTVADNVAEASDDVRAALAHVRRDAASLGVDPERLCVVVFSAGGPASGALLRERPAWLRCVAYFYPYLDLEHLRAASPFRPALGADAADALAAHSPRGALAAPGRAVPPLFVARGGRDAIPGLNASVDRFVREARVLGVPLELHEHPEGPHGFDVRAHDEPSRTILRAAVAFLRRHLAD
ncbi:alpha/beta hydrolase [Roseisolibacter sp. H3M3-2]|uniref:alpha/beta hydrolase n=1 Tax=Roseisolibacter sp. H3M3-2 TaxID=3031323 RepID=UPI0023DBD948|nr:alpha/beta hydrolase [Roseisolibacter sp. H3M3-2]MDF1503178.1 alpha/beta hydrolase [Roseisolibacter sp. H3M3-2]